MKSKKPMKKITLGICAMDKKAKSKPMREILSRLPADAFEIVMYGDECILNTPVEEWPVVEVLITFYSTRFPTEKALEYIKLRNPYLLNDLEIDSVMKDRRKVYELLESQGIDVPHHVFLNREPGVEDTNQLEEHDEVISFSFSLVCAFLSLSSPPSVF
jgi:inositol hexakisphosphate/diphosphoinositol-pentakisphosphate kinase